MATKEKQVSNSNNNNMTAANNNDNDNDDFINNNRSMSNDSYESFLDTRVPHADTLNQLDEQLTWDDATAMYGSSCQLPHPFRILPENITSLKECAQHEIRCLLNKTEDTLTTEDEDALDDGFVLADINVVVNKLRAWRALFPRIQPFFALKCHPDPMVAAVLGQWQAGFDCASLPEIQLAMASTTTRLLSWSLNHDNDSNINNYINNTSKTRRIVYANPQRAETDLETALKLHVRALTFDGPEELHKVHAAYQRVLLQHHTTSTTTTSNTTSTPPPPPVMILRLLVPDQHSTVPLGEKFGTPPSQIESLVQTAVELQLPVLGVSFHCGYV